MSDDTETRQRADIQALLRAHAAFYEAFLTRDFAAMQATCAARLPVACIHPGWGALVGREAVMASWRTILANPSSPTLAVDLIDVTVYDSTARILAYERINDAVLIATDMFWIAGMRAEIDDGDWKALLTDLAAIYSAETAEDAQEAARKFGDDWREKYPDVVQRLEEQLTDMEALLAAAAALKDAGLEYKQIVNAILAALPALDIDALKQKDPV